MKQDLMHTGVSRFHDKQRKGKKQAMLRATGHQMKRDREAIATALNTV